MRIHMNVRRHHVLKIITILVSFPEIVIIRFSSIAPMVYDSNITLP